MQVPQGVQKTVSATTSRETRSEPFLKLDTKSKCNIWNGQFQTAFKCKADSDLHSNGVSLFSFMGDVTELDHQAPVHKASSPDGLNARVLKECKNGISPQRAIIFNESFAWGDVLDGWGQANVSGHGF